MKNRIISLVTAIFFLSKVYAQETKLNFLEVNYLYCTDLTCIVSTSDKEYDMITRTGEKITLKREYFEIFPPIENKFQGVWMDESNNLHFVELDEKGNEIVKCPEIENIGQFVGGLAKHKNKMALIGFYDEECNLAIPYTFDKVEPFRNGKTIAKTWINRPKMDKAVVEEVLVKEDSINDLHFQRNRSIKSQPPPRPNYLCGVISNKNDTLVSFSHKKIIRTENDIFIASNGYKAIAFNSIDFSDTIGNYSKEWKFLKNFNDLLCYTRKVFIDGKYTKTDLKIVNAFNKKEYSCSIPGNLVTINSSSFQLVFSNRDDNKNYEYVSSIENGKTSEKFEKVYLFDDGNFIGKKESNYLIGNLFQSNGLEIDINKIQKVKGNYCIISNSKNKFGVIDSKGNIVFDLKYDYISFSFYTNDIILQKEGKSAIISFEEI